jgi:hypothetical protein
MECSVKYGSATPILPLTPFPGSQLCEQYRTNLKPDINSSDHPLFGEDVVAKPDLLVSYQYIPVNAFERRQLKNIIYTFSYFQTYYSRSLWYLFNNNIPALVSAFDNWQAFDCNSFPCLPRAWLENMFLNEPVSARQIFIFEQAMETIVTGQTKEIKLRLETDIFNQYYVDPDLLGHLHLQVNTVRLYCQNQTVLGEELFLPDSKYAEELCI